MRLIDSAEFGLLYAAESLNPRGEDRQDIRAAVMASAAANAFGGKTKPADWLKVLRVGIDEDGEGQDAEAMRRWAQQFAEPNGEGG